MGSGPDRGRFSPRLKIVADSATGQQIDAAALTPVFANDPSGWMKNRYRTRCAFTHARAGHTNGSLRNSNGPIYVPSAVEKVETEFRETLALVYLLLRIGWPGYSVGLVIRRAGTAKSPRWRPGQVVGLLRLTDAYEPGCSKASAETRRKIAYPLSASRDHARR